MSYANERAYIAQYFQNHPDFSSLGTVGFENLPIEDVATEDYCLFNILNFSSFQVSHGGTTNMHRFLGAVQVTVLATENSGLGSALTKADKIAGIFRNKRITISPTEWVNFEAPEIFRGQLSDGRFTVFVRCPFYRNEYL